jgi:hypothetical protein
MMTGNPENLVQVNISEELILDLYIVLRRKNNDENIDKFPRWIIHETESKIVVFDSDEINFFLVDLLKVLFNNLNFNNFILGEVAKSIIIDWQKIEAILE